ncbi:hypothetical protein D9758_006660 [Tetrapyrgos nigripes]|uniref:Uncharacterized protein n=1 Tax=Tetrapyrgos nigripes TaxID=182062 RepID=A0A8H5GJ69_9AGAR|nr:hypothetical protein D9758_006660 [Tetrapyrgos nigripes]
MPSPAPSLPAAPIETSSSPSSARRRQGRAGPANANVTPVDTAPANQAAFDTVSAVNTIETVTRTTQTSIQMFNQSRHPEFHSSLSSVGGDDRRSNVTYNYSIGSISLSNITLAANTEVTIHFGQDGNIQQHPRHARLETGNVGSQPAVRVVSRGRDDEAPSQARSE